MVFVGLAATVVYVGAAVVVYRDDVVVICSVVYVDVSVAGGDVDTVVVVPIALLGTAKMF